MYRTIKFYYVEIVRRDPRFIGMLKIYLDEIPFAVTVVAISHSVHWGETV